jgi:NAD(P)-dependent dehydrogenase (short-subunit alcohol dehydrogenase family)
VDTFDGRLVVVTGASGVLGAGLAQAFADAGASVLGVGRSPREPVAGVRYRAVDVADDAALGAFFDEEPVPWAVVNTVGGFAGRTPLVDLDPAVLLEQLRANLVTAALITKHALRRMLPAGTGRLVHTASRSALVTAGAGFAYSVSKVGVLHLVQMAAAEVRGTGVTVNCVVPSIIDTPANRAAMPDSDHDSWPKVPDIARTYLYLAAPGSGLVSGAAIPV